MITRKNHGAPSSTTPGNVGDYYIDVDTGKVYQCVDVETQGDDLGYVTVYANGGKKNTVYIWKSTVGDGADWNASEGEAGYVKNRTHYENEGDVVYRARTVQLNKWVWSDMYEDGDLVAPIINDPNYPAWQAAKVLKITIDGKEFVCTKRKDIRNQEYYGNVVLKAFADKNGSVTKATLIEQGWVDSGENFCLAYGKFYMLLGDYSSGDTIEVSAIALNVKPLDEKFLPTTVPTVQTTTVGQTVVVDEIDENGKPTKWKAADLSGGASDFVVSVSETSMMTEEADKTFVEIKQAHTENRPIVFKFENGAVVRSYLYKGIYFEVIVTVYSELQNVFVLQRYKFKNDNTIERINLTLSQSET